MNSNNKEKKDASIKITKNKEKLYIEKKEITWDEMKRRRYLKKSGEDFNDFNIEDNCRQFRDEFE